MAVPEDILYAPCPHERLRIECEKQSCRDYLRAVEAEGYVAADNSEDASGHRSRSPRRLVTMDVTHEGYDQAGGITAHRGPLESCPAPECQDRVAEQAAEQEGEGYELVCVDECGFCDACGMEPFGSPAEGWRETARFLRRTARESTFRQGALHGARLIEAELRRRADTALRERGIEPTDRADEK